MARRLIRLRPTALAALCAGCLVAAGTGPAAGAAAPATVHVVLNGAAVTMTPAPVMVGGAPYVSAKAVAQLLGVPATWDAQTKTLVLGASTASSVHSFVFQGVRYGVDGLQARTYPGPQSTSGTYWIVQYTLTNETNVAVNVPGTQPSLVLLGPGSAQYQPSSTASGPTAGTLNPHITFTSDAVFNVPVGAEPSAYALGFDAYHSTPKGFQPAALGARLPASTSRTETSNVGATYTVSNLWDTDVQEVLVQKVVRTTVLLPDLTSASFTPTTTDYIADVSINNPGASAITVAGSQFALQFSGGVSIAPYPVSGLPGFVPANSLFPASGSASSGSGGAQSGSGVTIAPGEVWTGAILFAVPTGVDTASPALAISVNGQQRVISLSPCSAACPPVVD